MSQPLTFSDVDGIAFASRRGTLECVSPGTELRAEALGPFLEYALLGAAGTLPRPHQATWLALGELTTFYQELRRRGPAWVCPKTKAIGIFRMLDSPRDDSAWVAFGLAAQRAAEARGFHRQTAAQFAAALGELYSNVHEHSGAARTGVAAFRVTKTQFEGVVADWGVGVLQSLRMNPDYANLDDDASALELVLRDGVSRFGSAGGRGKGFRPIFIGLANLNGTLRFRSGACALTIDGEGLGAVPWKLSEKVPIKGFFVSIACRAF